MLYNPQNPIVYFDIGEAIAILLTFVLMSFHGLMAGLKRVF